MTRFMWGTVTQVGPLRVRLDGDSAELPFSPDSLATVLVGDRVRCEITDRRVIVHGGTGDRAALPAGSITQTARSAAPDGWLLCQGQAVSRGTYADLFAAIGTAYGVGDGSTTFNVPDLRGRVPVGLDSTQSEFDTLGDAGGAKTHKHWAGGLFAALYHGYFKFRTSSVSWTATNSTSFTIPGSNSSSNAGGVAVEGETDAASNLPPYRVINYQIKT